MATTTEAMAEPRTRVMIVDDDHTFRDVLAEIISGQPGFELAGQGVDHPDAVRLAGRIRPQVVVLDSRMPGGDAPTTVRAIRDNDPNVEIVVLSAYEDAASAVELLTSVSPATCSRAPRTERSLTRLSVPRVGS